MEATFIGQQWIIIAHNQIEIKIIPFTVPGKQNCHTIIQDHHIQGQGFNIRQLKFIVCRTERYFRDHTSRL